MKKLLLSIALLFSSPIFVSAQQFWAEYQNNHQHYKSDSAGFTTHTLDAFYVGKEMKHGFSVNAFALATKGWGELLILPTWSKQTKNLGFFSFSLGAGIETATTSPRIGASVFYLNDPFQFLFFWEQGTNDWKNSWHLSYLMYTLVQHDDDTYCSFGLYSQRGTVHGVRSEIGIENKFTVWLVMGKPTLKKEKSIAVLLGLRYFF